MKNLLRHSLLALPLCLLGCAGYQLGNVPSGDMKDVKRLWVPMVKNDTFTPYLQPLVTNAVIHELDNDGTYQTGRAGESEATLAITVTKFDRTAVHYDPNNSTRTTEFRCTLTAVATLTNNITGKVIFSKVPFRGSTDYYVPNFNMGGDNVEAERQAMSQAAVNLARNIARQVTEGW